VINPPEMKNIERTWQTNSWENFMRAGLTTAYQMHSLVNELLCERESLRILDWGIGCGRVAVPLKRCLKPDVPVIGVDVDGVNVEWCRQNLPDIEVSVSDFFPPLEFEASRFDLVYGISVMTHLTEGAQHAWLKELRRILKPGGICVLRTHGEYAFFRNWDFIEQHGQLDFMIKQFSFNGISDWVNDGTLGPELDMKKYYRSTFQTRGQVEEQWSRYFKVIGYYPAGLHVAQDIVVMRKE
jgi:SAM-dependent methyltransferase